MRETLFTSHPVNARVSTSKPSVVLPRAQNLLELEGRFLLEPPNHCLRPGLLLTLAASLAAERWACARVAARAATSAEQLGAGGDSEPVAGEATSPFSFPASASASWLALVDLLPAAVPAGARALLAQARLSLFPRFNPPFSYKSPFCPLLVVDSHPAAFCFPPFQPPNINVRANHAA